MRSNDKNQITRQKKQSNIIGINKRTERINQNSLKRPKQKLIQKYKNHCIQKFGIQPSSYISKTFIKQKEKSINVDLGLIQNNDLPFIYELFRMPIIKLTIFYQQQKYQDKQGTKKFHQTLKFRQLLTKIGKALEGNELLKSLNLQNVPLSLEHMKIIATFVERPSYIRQFSMINCSITDSHLQQIKGAFGRAQFLTILNLSDNLLGKYSGKILGKILMQHSIRRDEVMWLASIRSQEMDIDQDLSKRGLCQINLENNQFDDNAVKDLILCLKDDQWTRCINLKRNSIEKQGVRQFAMLMKKNLTIISLDLRDNPGFSKQYSRYIIGKLKENLDRYRQYKSRCQNQQKTEFVKSQLGQNKKQKHRSMEQSRHRQTQRNHNSRNNLQFNAANNTLEVVVKPNTNNHSMLQYTEQGCNKCKQKTMQVLKLEKKNLDLQLELKRMKKILLRINIDTNISAIEPQHVHPAHQSITFESFHKMLGAHSETDEELLSKVEQIMMEMTKIMENIDAQQNTQINNSNNISNAHSLSNTIPLYPKVDQLENALGIDSNLNDNTEQMESPGRILSSSNNIEMHEETE